MTDSPKIVPFGKYKGQPLEALAQDRSYLDWLTAQDWFRERYANIYTLIVNNFAEPTETPDHNAPQVLFLDDVFCGKLFSVLWPYWRTFAFDQLGRALIGCRTELVKKRKEWEARQLDTYGYVSDEEQLAKHVAEQLAEKQNDLEQLDHAILKYDANIEWSLDWDKEFEKKGVDVALSCTLEVGVFPILNKAHFDPRIEDEYFCHEINPSARIEIKPVISDDYPAVLRQMRANETNVLFTEKYTGVGATEEQFIQTFALSDIKVAFRRDVDAVQAEPLTGTVTLRN
jgi:hypothetical protein